MNNQLLEKVSNTIRDNAPYWAGEYEIAQRYFGSDLRSRKGDAEWIQLQMFKEWAGSGVYGRGNVTVLSMAQKSTDRLKLVRPGTSVSELESIKQDLLFASDEFDHYILLARAYQYVAPEDDMTIDEMCHINEGHKMIDMRQSYRDRPHGDITVELTEGGGLGLYFGVKDAFLQRGIQSDLDKCIVKFAEATILDETHHMKWRFSRALDAGISAEEWDIVNKNLQELFAQKLRERNQQFGSLFTNDELDRMGSDIGAGQYYLNNHLGFLTESLTAKFTF